MIDNTCLRAHALPHRPPCLGPYESRGRDMVPCESSGSDSDNHVAFAIRTRRNAHLSHVPPPATAMQICCIFPRDQFACVTLIPDGEIRTCHFSPVIYIGRMRQSRLACVSTVNINMVLWLKSIAHIASSEPT